MLKQFLSHLSENTLAFADDKVLLAVSGGLDSMVMLDLFVKAGFSCEVAHVNFQLRGEESNQDELFVKKHCAAYRVPCHVLHASTRSLAESKGISIQMAARELRYDWFQSLLTKNKLHCVATAHHLNDSIETSLFNWVNGASLVGLVGIPVRNGAIIRPLLFATRSRIEQYASENDLVWREDSSNNTDDYTRNYIRHQLIPRLKEINPSLEQTVFRGQQKLAGEHALSESAFLDWKQKSVKQSHTGLVIDKASLLGKSGGVMLLFKLLQSSGFNFEVCEDISLALRGQSGKTFFSSSHQVVVDRESLFLTSLAAVELPTILLETSREVRLGNLTIKMDKVSVVAPSADPRVAVLDADTLHFPLVWRLWKQGDFFYPLGMEHRKKLSDFLVDTKVSILEKQHLTVLESKGEIVWVVGHRIDNRFKLTEDTTHAWVFTVTTDFS